MLSSYVGAWRGFRRLYFSSQEFQGYVKCTYDSETTITDRTDTKNSYLFLFDILFKDGQLLQLRPETVAVRRQMRNGLDDYDGQNGVWG